MNKKNQEAIIIHPGEVLREDFLLPLKLTPEKLAKNIKVKPQIIQELITEKRDLDKDLATRLALYFDMSTEFWLGIQHDYEQDCIENLRTNLRKEIIPLRVSEKKWPPNQFDKNVAIVGLTTKKQVSPSWKGTVLPNYWKIVRRKNKVLPRF